MPMVEMTCQRVWLALTAFAGTLMITGRGWGDDFDGKLQNLRRTRRPIAEFGVGLGPAAAAFEENYHVGIMIRGLAFVRPDPHHAFGFEVDHARFPWRFSETHSVTAPLFVWRWYGSTRSVWDPHVGIGFGVGFTRPGNDCDEAGPFLARLGGGVGNFVAPSTRLGIGASFSARMPPYGCSASQSSGAVNEGGGVFAFGSL